MDKSSFERNCFLWRTLVWTSPHRAPCHGRRGPCGGAGRVATSSKSGRSGKASSCNAALCCHEALSFEGDSARLSWTPSRGGLSRESRGCRAARCGRSRLRSDPAEENGRVYQCLCSSAAQPSSGSKACPQAGTWPAACQPDSRAPYTRRDGRGSPAA